MKETPVTVIFRLDPDGTPFALFPDLTADPAGRCTSYQHVGQHGAADYAFCISRSRPATEREYAPLATELRAIGYTLNIRNRRFCR